MKPYSRSVEVPTKTTRAVRRYAAKVQGYGPQGYGEFPLRFQTYADAPAVEPGIDGNKSQEHKLD